MLQYLTAIAVGNADSFQASITPPTGSVGSPDFNSYHPTQDGSLPGLNLLDLELLHNYMTSTAPSLSSDPTLKTLWKINVPQLGFSYDFVMRGILALSAIHMAHYNPEKKEYYVSQALQHHQIGLRSITSLLSNINEENCTAVYIFSALTFVFTMGRDRKPGGFLLVEENGVADWLFLIKGTSAIIDSSMPHLFEGPLSPMFIAGKRRMDLREASLAEAPQHEDPLRELQEYINAMIDDCESVPVYTAAISLLRKSFALYFKKDNFRIETGDVMVWIMHVSDEYVNRLRKHTQVSLVILGFFCVILRMLDSHWFMEGWATHLISKIYHLLDEEHRLWIRWPIEEIGWIPPKK
jgi:hypothetical protein